MNCKTISIQSFERNCNVIKRVNKETVFYTKRKNKYIYPRREILRTI